MLQRLRAFLGIRFVRDVLTLQAGTGVYMVGTFVASIVVARVLGPDAFGAYAIALSVVGTVTALTSLGQGGTLLVFFSEEHGKRDMRGMSIVLRNYIHVGIAACVVYAAASWAAPSWLRSLYGNDALALPVQAFLFFQITEIWTSMTIVILQALRRIRSKVLFEQGSRLAGVVAMIVAVVGGYGVVGIALSQCLIGVIMSFISAYMLRSLAARGEIPGMQSILRVAVVDTKHHFFQGLLIAADKSLGNLFPSGLLFLLSLWAPAASVGIARIATQLAGLPRMVFLPQVVDMSVSVLGQLKAAGLTKLRQHAALIVKHALAGHALLSFASMIVLPALVSVAYGPAYARAVPLTLWLILLSLPVALCVVNSPLLRLERRTHLSIVQGLAAWVVMPFALLAGARLGNPLGGFAVAYAVAQVFPLSVTAYLFFVRLRPVTVKSR